MKASRKIAIVLLIALMFGAYPPRSARADIPEMAGEVAKWLAVIVAGWFVEKALDSAAINNKCGRCS